MASDLRFFDFCSGIGGGRLGLEMLGMDCVGHSEIESYSGQNLRTFF